MDNAGNALLPFVGEDSLESLKKSALMVDKVTLVFLTSIPRAKRARFPLSVAYYNEDQISRVSTDLNLLFDHGLLDAPTEDPISSGFEMEDFDGNLPVWVIRTAKSTCYFQPGKGSFDETLSEMTRPEWFMEATPELGISGIRNSLHNIPIVLGSRSLQQQQSRAAAQDNQNLVLDLMLANVPQPSIETPWEAILDWRNDEEAKIKFRRLKNWMNKTSERKDLNPDHLRDEVLYLLDEYQQYMKIQKAKFSTSTLRTIVTGAAEVLESLTKLKFKALAEMPFKISEAHLAVREAELKAPGRELAYIVDANDNFK
ncbi:hypothetical protein [Pseudomonas syringae]|uniref:hypothetical protein n=1 Tax=Pseudomonas syringae TaxID=317 RepID=UPI000E3269CD|nr:hypothetical protein [Pseudomonas syringae]